MGKTCWRFTPVNGYDIPALEQWLAAMAAKGLFFHMSFGPFTLFHRAEPAQLQVHLEPAWEKTDQDDPELNALYEQAGWQYLGIFRKNYFIFATADQQAQAHTDQEILEYSLRRFFRQKLLGGLALLLGNAFLLCALWPSRPGFGFWYGLRWYPVESIFETGLLPFSVAVLGLFLVDLSYLLGLLLLRWRRAARPTSYRRPARHIGSLLTTGLLILLPACAQLVSDMTVGYSPLPLEDYSLVTMGDIEETDFQISQDSFYSMEYIAHGNTLLEPEWWYFQQYGAFPHFDGSLNLNGIPHMEISAKRYPLPVLAAQRVDELIRGVPYFYGYPTRSFQELPPVSGLDQVLAAQDESWGMTLILRRGSTVLVVGYRGDKNLAEHLEQFAQLLVEL